MRTIEQIKADILAGNPSRKYIINDEEFEQTDAEFEEAVQKRAEMEYEQQVYLENIRQEKLTKILGYRKLSLTDAEITALLGLTEEEATELLGGNQMATGRIGTTPVLQVRWSKAPSAGTTSLSGLDDNSVSLVYSVGYEAVYRNGVLLSRTNDYTATNGTTVTLIDATIAGDIIEIFATQTVPLTDTYSQTVSDGRFIKNTLTTTTGDIIYASAANTPARLAIGSTDQVLKVSGGIPAWGAAAPIFPAFSAYKNADQTITANTWTKISFQTERFDTGSCYDATTNYRFTPNVAGKYFVNAALRINQGSAGNGWWAFYKNGSLDRYIEGGALDTFQWTAGGVMIDLNGSTDYVECYVFITNGGTIPNGSSEYPTFEAFGARS